MANTTNKGAGKSQLPYEYKSEYLKNYRAKQNGQEIAPSNNGYEYKSSYLQQYREKQKQQANEQMLSEMVEAEAPRRANLKDLTLGSIGRGYATSKYGNERYDEIMLGTQRQAKQAQKAKEKTEQEKYNFAAQSGLGKTISGAGELIGQWIYNLTNRDTLASVGANVAGAAAVGAAVPLPEELVTMPTAVARGLKLGSAATMHQVEAANAYDEMVAAGVSDKDAKIVANLIGLGVGALEAIQADKLAKSVNLLKGVKGEASQKAATRLAEALSKKQVAKAAGKIAGATAFQTAQEVAQEGVNIAGQNIARKNANVDTISGEEAGQRLKDTAIQSALSFGLLEGVGAVGGAMMNRNNIKAQTNEANAEESDADSATNIRKKDATEQTEEKPLALPQYATKPTLYADKDGLKTSLNERETEIFTEAFPDNREIENSEMVNKVLYAANKANKDPVAVAESNFKAAEADIQPYLEQTIAEYEAFIGEGVAVNSETNQRMSNNPQWYRDYYAKHKKAPSKADKKAIGEKMFWEDVAKGGGNYVPPEIAQRYNAFKGVAEQLKGLPLDTMYVGDGTAVTAKKGYKPVYSPTQSKQVAVDTRKFAVEKRYGQQGKDSLTRLNNATESRLAEFDRYYRAGTANQQRPADSNILSKNEATAAFLAGMADAKANKEAYANKKVAVNKKAGLNMATANHLTLRERITWDRFAKALGVRISFVDTLGNKNAKYNMATGEIIIARDATNFDTVLVHEIVHRLRQTSPNEFYELAQSVLDLLESQGKLEGAMAEYGELYGLTEGSIEYFDTMEEIVADFMANEVTTEELINMVNAKPSVAEKLLKIIEEIIYKLADLNDAELKQTKANLQDLHDKMKKAVNASENAVKATTEKAQKFTVEQTNVEGDVLTIKDKETGDVRHNLWSYNNGGRQVLMNTLAKQKFPAEDVKRAADIMGEMAQMMENFAKKYANILDWNNTEVLYDQNGRTYYSAMVKNGDYKINIDLSTICKKRVALQNVLNKLVKQNLINDVSLSPENIATINKILKKNGYETQCPACFVESKRYNVEKWANDFANKWNNALEKAGFTANGTFDFSHGVKPDHMDAMAMLTDDLSKADEMLANIGTPKRDENGNILYNKKGKPQMYKPNTEQKIVMLLKNNPQLRKRFTAQDLIGTEGIKNIKTQYPDIYSLILTQWGVATPKIVQTTIPYNNEVAVYKNIAKNSKYIGGVRMFSFSDFTIDQVFDYVQIVADLYAQKAMMHTYTKEITFAKLFGTTGIKINLSFIPAINKALGKENAGLDANGELIYSEWGVDPDEAKDLMQDKRYSPNLTPVMIGVSDNHIRKLLDTDFIRYIIPYHKSSLNPVVAKMTDIEYYEDYSDFQTTRHADGTQLTKAENNKFDFYKTLEKTKDARATADAYLDWCDENEYIPKFEQFREHKNYYKLLVDFNLYDAVTDEFVPQKPVTMDFPAEFNEIVGEELAKQKELSDKLGIEEDRTFKEIVNAIKKPDSDVRESRMLENANNIDYTDNETTVYEIKFADLKGKAKQLYLSGKNGNINDAVEYAETIVSKKTINRLARHGENVFILPISKENGKNQNTKALAQVVSIANKQPVFENVYQETKDSTKNKTVWERMHLSYPQFYFGADVDVKEIKGKKFIVVDDNSTSGRTFKGLIYFIEELGGEVVDCYASTVGGDKSALHFVSNETWERFLELGIEKIKQFAVNEGILRDISQRGLTENEAQTLYKRAVNFYGVQYRASVDGKENKNSETSGTRQERYANNGSNYEEQGNSRKNNEQGKINTRDSKKTEPIIPDGYKERGFNESVRTKTDYDDIVQQEFIDNPEIYKQLANKVTKEKAKAIMDKGLAFAETEFPKLLERMDATAIALGDMMAREYSNMGEYDKAVTVIRDMAKQLTKAGQFSQAAVIALTKSNPMTALAYAKRDIDKLNADGHKQFGKKWKDFELTADEEEMFENIKQGDADAIKAAYEKINKRIAKEYPSTIWQKFIEASRISMLLNPRTNAKNIASNMLLRPITRTSGIVSAGIQKVYKYFNNDYTPTQAVTVRKETKKLAEDIWNNIKDTLDTTSKYNEGIKANKRDIVVFKEGANTRVMENIAPGTLHKLNQLMGEEDAGLMETLRHATYWFLEIGDNRYVRKNFLDRLGSYLEAQGIREITEANQETIDTAVQVAYREAMRATFKDDTALSKWMASIKHTGNPYIDAMMEMIMPFTKTPANIAMRGIDYSPIGLLNTLNKYSKNKDFDELADELGKNLLGSALIAFGAWLFSKGLVTGGEPENEKEAAFLKQQGWLPYAVKVGDSYTTYDWAQPAAIPIIMGVTIMESLEEGRLGVVDAVKNAGVASFNQWVELSPLQSLKEVMGGYGTVGENLLNTAIEMPQRLIPSALGATARTADTTQRLTYSKGNVAQTQKDLAKSKVPGLSQTLPAAYDTWGNVKKRDNSTGIAAINQFINPASYKRSNATEVDREIERLYESLGDEAVYPRKAEYSIKKDGKTYELNNREYSEYQRIMGQLSYDNVKALMDNAAYDSLTDYEKGKIIEKIYSNAFETAKYAVLEGKGYEKTDADIKDMQETKIKQAYLDYNANNIAEYYIAHQILNNADSDKTANGTTIAGSKKKNGINRLVELGFTRGEARRLHDRLKG